MPEETVLERDLVSPGEYFPMNKNRALSEKETIELVKKGDKEAFRVIVSQYMQRAYYIALGFVHNHQDALDISQESFVKAFRKIKTFNTQKPFFPWFYRLLKNLCLDHLKKRSRLKEIPLEEIQVLSGEKEDKDMKEVLWRGIERLPFEQREVVVLRYFQQFSYKEIAEVTEKSIGTVMSSLFYAKKRLKEIVGKYLGFE